MSTTNRTAITVAGLGTVTALVLLATITVDDPDASGFPDADYASNPCQQVLDADDVTDRLGWFYDDPKVPGALVNRASRQLLGCSSIGTLNTDGEVVGRVLAVGFAFFEGDAPEPAVWWLFYPDDAGVSTLDVSLVSLTGNAELEFFDGYVVAFGKKASQAIRTAARSTADRDAATIEVAGRISTHEGFVPDVSR